MGTLANLIIVIVNIKHKITSKDFARLVKLWGIALLSIHLELTTKSVNSLVEFLRLFRFLLSWLLKDIAILLLVFGNFYWIELITFFAYFHFFLEGSSS